MSLIYTSMEHAVHVLRNDIEGCKAVEIVKTMMARKQKLVPPESSLRSPVILVEGPDGVGKSTLIVNLQHKLGQSTTCLKSPPEELMHLRPHFDAQPKEMRRAFYALGNYGCALRMRELAAEGPVVVDRFWPSTVAYAIAHDLKVMPDEVPELLGMPDDLASLLPEANPVIFMLLDLPEADRAKRVRERPTGFSLQITREEEELEHSSSHRARLSAAYRALRVDGDPLTVCDASGSEQEVLDRVVHVVESKVREEQKLIPTSVNWHFTRMCNYSCKFCFHTASSSFFLPSNPDGMKEAKKCLWKLRAAGMKKLNFSGGEPFLQPKELGELCRFSKEDLHLESVSIVSNGSKIKPWWFKNFAQFVDILAISCDSFDENTNMRIGRGKGMHLKQLAQVRAWCTEFDVPFKLNSVINIHNVDEDMTEAIIKLNPVRWKVFQCLLLSGENVGDGALRDAQDLVITDAQFHSFVEKHSSLKCLVPESNEKMKDSYLILDEYLRFLNCTGGRKDPSGSIREVSVRRALKDAGFDKDMFVKRGGIYNWSKPGMPKVPDLEDLAMGGDVKVEVKTDHVGQHIEKSFARDTLEAGTKTFIAVSITVGLVVCLASNARFSSRPRA